jgi:hypothetical protein
MEYQNGQPLPGRAPAGAYGPAFEQISRHQGTVPIFSAVVASSLPLVTLADGGTVSLGYGQTDNDFQNLDTWRLTGTYTRAFENGFVVDVTGRASQLDGDVDEGQIFNVFGRAGYQFSNGIVAGAFIQRFNLDENDTEFLILDSYGLSLGYAAGRVDVSAYLGETKEEDSGETFDEWGGCEQAT